METLHAIRTRRSIRQFTDQPIPAKTLRKILEAAMMAPSAGNAQPWQFIIVTDRNKMAKVKTYSPFAGMAAQAALAVLVCGDLSLEKYPGYWVQDCSAATQNLLLAAHAIGLGAVWTGVYPKEERIKGFRADFGLPDHVVPLAFVPMGWPSATLPITETRFRQDRIHENQW